MINRNELLSGIKNDDPGIRENLEKVYNIDVKERLLNLLNRLNSAFSLFPRLQHIHITLLYIMVFVKNSTIAKIYNIQKAKTCKPPLKHPG